MIHIGGKTFFNNQLFVNNIRYINDIIEEDGSFYTYDTFCNTYQDVKLNFLEYAGIIHAVKTWKKKCGENNKFVKLSNPLIKSDIYNVLKCTKAKCFYEFLNKNSSVTTGKAKWSELFDIDNIEWKAIHKTPFKVTKNSKLQWFQYRIINKILATNSFLFKIKKANSKMCTFCHNEVETIEHIFWECNLVQSFLNDFESFLEQKTNYKLTFNKKSFIFGFLEKSKVVQNTILLWLKFYLYVAKCSEKPLNVRFAISYLKSFYDTQKFICYKNGDNESFDTHWNN